MGEVPTWLAPEFFVTAECDILRDQALAYAEKLAMAGVAVDGFLYQVDPHVFVAMAGTLDQGRAALRDSVISLRKAFDQRID